MQCSAKGIGDAYAIHSVATWIDRLGHKRFIVQTDGENAVKAFVRKVKAKSAGDLVLRTSVPGNWASLGAGEQIQGVIAGMFRSLKSELEADLNSDSQNRPGGVTHRVSGVFPSRGGKKCVCLYVVWRI